MTSHFAQKLKPFFFNVSQDFHLLRAGPSGARNERKSFGLLYSAYMGLPCFASSGIRLVAHPSITILLSN
jgi:hypothetical protein